MSWVTIDGLRVGYGSAPVLVDVGLQIPRGSLVAVLGPSGCGKTTMLRAIAGLLPTTGGSIRVGDKLLSGPGKQLAPEKRGIGWVPQDASLFPHLTVGENIGFGLARGGGRSARITELAALVGLGDYLDRAPSQLSGGQAQRVSLARALAPRPDLVLLDEPFAALDPLLRTSLRAEVAELLRLQQSTSLLVTHDQEEALSLADHVAVMMAGRIVQWGTPVEVYERPATTWVARFVGDTVELDGRWSAGSVDTALGLLEADPVGGVVPGEGDSVRVVLRPEWLELAASGTDAVVSAIAYAGHDALVSLVLDSGVMVRARIAAPKLPERSDRVRVAVSHRALVYPHASAVVPTAV
ncbi:MULTISPECIES: ABC transporter ATP-binding protein [unclassified Diaminobutyricimonas]|uniref:ABC transporter ATP-binding protein n=1 Tax=unclassified Diaminobutyricimonas TaxID=2643261 RepID=UPI0012F4D7AE|nr:MULTISPECIES: ABC transporter ATP-binding protein [unclassified Diaminobutyricimonas]